MPTWIDCQTLYEIIIVDYGVDQQDCLPHLFNSLKSQVLIRHLQCLYLEQFCLSHARNIGASLASAEWLLFIDIDTLLLPNAIEKICQYIKNDNVYFAAIDSQVKKDIINGGLILVKKSDHHKIHGFNERIIGWGYEDIDYKQRLERTGIIWKLLNSGIYKCIDHPDTERTQCYSIDKEVSWTKNRQIALQTWSEELYGEWKYCFETKYGGNRET